MVGREADAKGWCRRKAVDEEGLAAPILTWDTLDEIKIRVICPASADRERERQRDEQRKQQEAAERAQREAEEQARAAAEAEQRRLAEAAAALQRRKTAARQALPSEPAAGTPGTALIRIRLPDGSNHQRRFLAGGALQVRT